MRYYEIRKTMWNHCLSYLNNGSTAYMAAADCRLNKLDVEHLWLHSSRWRHESHCWEREGSRSCWHIVCICKDTVACIPPMLSWWHACWELGTYTCKEVFHIVFSVERTWSSDRCSAGYAFFFYSDDRAASMSDGKESNVAFFLSTNLCGMGFWCWS